MSYKRASVVAILGFVCVFGASTRTTKENLVATSVLSGLPAASNFSPISPLLPAFARARISAALGHDLSHYQVRTSNTGSVYVENSRHALVANFSSHGVEFKHRNMRWAISLRGYGYSDALKPAGEVVPKASFNQVEYERDGLVEWYANGPAGLEQGFTISNAPGRSTGQPLTLAVALSGDLQAAVDKDRKGLSLTESLRKPSLRYAGLTAYDAAGKQLPAWLELRGAKLLLRVDDSTAAYPVVVDPIVQLAKLTASDGMDGDQMGISVAISGNTIVAGAQSATVGGNALQGAAYVFVKPSSGWANMTETAKLTASDGRANDGFGGAVGIAGNTIAIGACSQSGMCNGHGKLYVFLKPTNGWKTTSKFKAKLTASDGKPDDGFSNMMSISADGHTIAVGAWGATLGGKTSEGAAYVFEKPSSGWKTMHESAKLTEARGAAYDDFGNVAISGDGATLFVVAIQLNTTTNKATGPGKAYIFLRPAGGWKTTSEYAAKLSASDGAKGDGFGFCQTGAACISSDGTTVLASAPQFSVGNTGAGKVYIFVKPTSGWKTTSHFTAKLTASDGQPGAAFGWSPAVTDDRAVVGAAGVSAAYVFNKPRSGWKTTSKFNAKLISSDGMKGVFGFSTAISGNTIAVGALSSPGNSGPGATFVFGP
jgi:hypothetical protein